MASLTNPTYSCIYVNVLEQQRFKSSAYGNEARMILTLSAGDYVEGYTYQASGGAVNIQGTEASGDINVLKDLINRNIIMGTIKTTNIETITGSNPDSWSIRRDY